MKLTLIFGLLLSVFSAQATVVNCSYKTEEEFSKLSDNYDVFITVNDIIIINGKDTITENDKLMVIMKQASEDHRQVKKTPIKTTQISVIQPHGPYKADTVVFTMSDNSSLNTIAVYSQGEEHVMDTLRTSTSVTMTCRPKKVLEVGQLLKGALDASTCVQDA